MAKREQNRNTGNASTLGRALRNSGGLPPNPVPAIQRLINNPSVPTSPLERIGQRLGLKTNAIPSRTVPPINARPKFRVVPDLPNGGNRPSKNLAGILHGIQDSINLHPSVLASPPVPYHISKQIKDTVARYPIKIGSPFKHTDPMQRPSLPSPPKIDLRK